MLLGFAPNNNNANDNQNLGGDFNPEEFLGIENDQDDAMGDEAAPLMNAPADDWFNRDNTQAQEVNPRDKAQQLLNEGKVDQGTNELNKICCQPSAHFERAIIKHVVNLVPTSKES